MNQSQSLNHYRVKHRESESESKKVANYLKKSMGYYFKNAKRYGNHIGSSRASGSSLRGLETSLLGLIKRFFFNYHIHGYAGALQPAILLQHDTRL